MTPEHEQTEQNLTESESHRTAYEPPTLTSLGTTQEAMADVGGFSGGF